MRLSRHRRLLLTTALTAVAAMTLSGTPALAEPPTPAPLRTSVQPGHEENLGQTMPDKILSQDQSQGVDAAGNPQVYWVTAGNDETTAMFQATDVRTGRIVFAERLPRGINSWANTFSPAEGAVYFATTEGYFYTWTPGDENVTAIPFPYPGEGIWRLAAAPDGIIYGGTYPGGRLFAYDPATARFTDHGQIIPGETYGRALAVDDDHVYFGTQPRARLARFDRATGEVLQMPLPARYANEEAVYDMTLAGGYLLARVQKVNDLLVFDTATAQLVHVVPAIDGRAISGLDPTGPYVYYRRVSQGIVQLNLETFEETPLGWRPNAIPGTWAWIDMQSPDFPGLSLSMTFYNGRVYVYNLQTKRNRYISEAGLQGAPTPLQALGVDRAGTVYSGGFLTPPGISAYNPDTNAFRLLNGGGQVEGFGQFGDDLVYGRYPGGTLYRYDPARTWSMGTNPGEPVTIGQEQDRPQALVQIGDRVVVGSVPISGRLGGALSVWKPDTGEITVRRGIVADQSVVSLAARGDLVVGGTSINGGFGIDPVASQAELFVYDVTTGTVRESRVVVPGAQSINGLRFDDEGVLWGIADGTLFAAGVDPATGTIDVLRAENLFGLARTMYGQDRALAFRDGMIYATYGGRLWSVNPVTWKARALAGSGAEHLVAGVDGSLYYTRGFTLYRWVFDPVAAPPACTETITGAHRGPLQVSRGVTCVIGGQVSGPVTVRPGAGLVLDGARVDGPVTATGASHLSTFDAEVRGPLSVSASTGPVRVDSSTVRGPVTLTANRGGEVTVTATTVGGPLTCTANTTAPGNAGVANTVSGPRTGQCAAL
ncbi:hypothetical protein [Polymorphospora rubra]|uniref:Uncharacterized protein n=1 Tax=Polymorphospora rubra TaxID=338584 RepID=A0A810MUR4_9ACTN|nr:hypothetical protein [Polymorphospora rubra]BCJ64270.1 hypothetical protein Prubr_12910 [Polymorphospora rubra]